MQKQTYDIISHHQVDENYDQTFFTIIIEGLNDSRNGNFGYYNNKADNFNHDCRFENIYSIFYFIEVSEVKLAIAFWILSDKNDKIFLTNMKLFFR